MPNFLDFIILFVKIKDMVFLVMLLLCFMVCATPDTEDEFDLFEQNLDVFVKDPKTHKNLMESIKQGVFEEAAWLREITDSPDYCEKI